MHMQAQTHKFHYKDTFHVVHDLQCQWAAREVCLDWLTLAFRAHCRAAPRRPLLRHLTPTTRHTDWAAESRQGKGAYHTIDCSYCWQCSEYLTLPTRLGLQTLHTEKTNYQSVSCSS